MVSVIIVALIVLFCLMAFIAYKNREKAKYYERIGNSAILEYEKLSDEFNRLKKANEIKLKNKEKADEEIANLNDGDYTTNVLNKLRKHTKN